MTTAAGVAAAVALVGALVALAFLPSRAKAESPAMDDGLPEPAPA